MRLKKLFAVHHGEYSATRGTLTKNGVAQASRLADAIAHRIGNDTSSPIRLLTSPRPHAIEAANIIAKRLGVIPELCIQLLIDYQNHQEDSGRQLDVVLDRSRGCETIITISHAETAAGIIYAAAKKFVDPEIKPLNKRKGQAICLCLESREIRSFAE